MSPSTLHLGRCGISKLHRATPLIQKRFVAHHLKEISRASARPVAALHPSVVTFMADKDNKPDTRQKAQAMEAVEEMFDRYHKLAKRNKATYFDAHLMETARIITANTADEKCHGSVEFALPIDSTYANVNDVMHGGAFAVVFDMLTTSALAPLSRPGYWEFLGGVTRSLNISYLKAVPIGKTVKIRSEVVQIGRQMAMIRGTMLSMDETTIYATCEHHKVNVPMKKDHGQVVSTLGKVEKPDPVGPKFSFQPFEPFEGERPELTRNFNSRRIRAEKRERSADEAEKDALTWKTMAKLQIEEARRKGDAKL